MERIPDALLAGAGMLWQSLWALILGYAVSAGIQVLVTRAQMARSLGSAGLRPVLRAMLFGALSSSCSLAALAAARTVLAKGAHPTAALVFLVAATNLVVPLGLLLWVLLGWRFVLANLLLGLLMIAYAGLLIRLILPPALARRARAMARRPTPLDGPDLDAGGYDWLDAVTSRAGWLLLADMFVAEGRQVWKEVLFGFALAGLVATLVPATAWDTLFPGTGPGPQPALWTVLAQAAAAPLVAFVTVMGSLGNAPLAAALWSQGVSFAGVLAFLGADLLAAMAVWVNGKYYGWAYAVRLALLLYPAMVAAGVSVHLLFAAVGGIPDDRPPVQSLVRFSIDHTLVLNLAALTIAGMLLRLHRIGPGGAGHDPEAPGAPPPSAPGARNHKGGRRVVGP